MTARNAIRVVVPLASMILLAALGGGVGPRVAWSQVQPSRPRPPTRGRSAQLDEAFVRDYNKGDSKALAALFTEDAEVVEADGAATRAAT